MFDFFCDIEGAWLAAFQRSVNRIEIILTDKKRWQLMNSGKVNRFGKHPGFGRALAGPLWSAAVWESADLDEGRRRATGSRPGEFYARYSNPTVRAFEEAIAELEGAEDALAFGSGMGAISSVLLALCSSGDHVVASRQLYAGTSALLSGPLARFGVSTTFVDGTDAEGALAHTRDVLWRIAGTVRTLVGSWHGKPPRVWLVSRGGLVVTPGDAANPGVSSTNALVRVLAYEHPDLRVTLVDTGADTDAVSLLITEIDADGTDDVVA